MSTRTIVGPYELVHALSDSADGERWLAKGPLGAAIVEVWTATDAGLRADLAAEARAMIALEHAGLARVIAAGESDAPPAAWVALPAEMSDDLEALAPLPPHLAARVVFDVATTLAYAHGVGRVHGALTGHHVLVGYDGVVRLTGFGAAQRASMERARSGAMTPGLAAVLSPELCAGGKVSPATDVYALGQLLARAAGDVQALPVALQSIHEQSTQTEPGSRLPSASAFAEALRDAAARELGALPSPADLAVYLRETVPTRREDRTRQWMSVTSTISNPLIAPVSFNIPRDPSNPGSTIPLFDASITNLFVREASGADSSADPLKQSAPIAGTWAALSTAFSAPPGTSTKSLPPMPAVTRDEGARDGATLPIVGTMLAIAIAAFGLGAVYLGPSAQADLSVAVTTRPPSPPAVVPNLPVLPVAEPAMWVVPRPSPAP